MCDSCDGISRRRFLKVAGIGVVAAGLMGCPPPPVANDLPDAYEDQLEGEPTPGVKPAVVNPAKIILPPPTPAQASDYGDIMPRRAWTGAGADLSRGRPMGGVQRITIHHSGDGKPFLADSIPDTIRHLQIVRQAHLQRGMIDIAYHFAVDRAGRVWQLRSLRYEGQHVRIGKNGTRWNEHNIGIVTLGDFNLQSPTKAQLGRVIAFAHLVREKYAVASGFVKLHGELVETDCPGRRLGPALKDARTRGAI